MKIYKCSWPNGTFSIVHAKNKPDAVFILDEWGAADEEMLKELKEFVMDFNFDPEAVTEGVKAEAVEVEESDDFDCTRLYRWSMSEGTSEEIGLLSPAEVVAHLDEEYAKFERETNEVYKREFGVGRKDSALN